jgi:hypothetical protein
LNIIAVDWGKEAGKRSAYRADLPSRVISRSGFDGTLEHLLDYAASLTSPVLIGIDAAIGFPAAAWQRLGYQPGPGSVTFIDYLLDPSLPADFFEAVSGPEEWSPLRPFVRPPPRQRWSLKAFDAASGNGFYRRIDRQLKANPIFLTSGIPGSVGSGTRALWQELIALAGVSPFRVWPFHGPLSSLLESGKPVVAEIYPKACYGIALAKTLPATLTALPKTRVRARQGALGGLLASTWVAREGVMFEDLDAAVKSEDDFDALMSAAALMRLHLEGAPIESPGTVDAVAEGGVLGAASVS